MHCDKKNISTTAGQFGSTFNGDVYWIAVIIFLDFIDILSFPEDMHYHNCNVVWQLLILSRVKTDLNSLSALDFATIVLAYRWALAAAFFYVPGMLYNSDFALWCGCNNNCASQWICVFWLKCKRYRYINEPFPPTFERWNEFMIYTHFELLTNYYLSYTVCL